MCPGSRDGGNEGVGLNKWTGRGVLLFNKWEKVCVWPQAAGEEKAAASAKEGLGRRAREAEASAQALAETVEELRLTLDRQRASAELRYTLCNPSLVSPDPI